MSLGEEFAGQRCRHHDFLSVVQVAERTFHAFVAEEVEELRVTDVSGVQFADTLHGQGRFAVAFLGVCQTVIGEISDVHLINRFHAIEAVEEVGHFIVGHPMGKALVMCVVLHAVHPFGVREAAVVAAVVADLRHEDHEDGQGGGEAEEGEDFWGFHI